MLVAVSDNKVLELQQDLAVPGLAQGDKYECKRGRSINIIGTPSETALTDSFDGPGLEES